MVPMRVVQGCRRNPPRGETATVGGVCAGAASRRRPRARRGPAGAGAGGALPCIAPRCLQLVCGVVHRRRSGGQRCQLRSSMGLLSASLTATPAVRSCLRLCLRFVWSVLGLDRLCFCMRILWLPLSRARVLLMLCSRCWCLFMQPRVLATSAVHLRTASGRAVSP